MKRIIMSLREYEEDKKSIKHDGVALGIFVVLAHLRGETDFSESGYQQYPENCRYIKEIEQIIESKQK